MSTLVPAARAKTSPEKVFFPVGGVSVHLLIHREESWTGLAVITGDCRRAVTEGPSTGYRIKYGGSAGCRLPACRRR
jgi:hypothetical protein